MTTSRSRKRSLTSDNYQKSYANESYDNSTPRSGKWTVEEENFALKLIKDFEAGLLHDCEDGCTLRSYLARKLNCAPMRISKKFAGKCIGKHMFTRRIGYSSEDDNNLSGGEANELERCKYPRLTVSMTATSNNISIRAISPHGSDLSDYSDDSLQSPDSSYEGSYHWPESGNFNPLAAYSSNLVHGKLSNKCDILRTLSFNALANSPSNNILHIDFDFPSGGSDSSTYATNCSISEAAEWHDVLSYFCGDMVSFDEQSESSVQSLPRVGSYASLFIE